MNSPNRDRYKTGDTVYAVFLSADISGHSVLSHIKSDQEAAETKENFEAYVVNHVQACNGDRLTPWAADGGVFFFDAGEREVDDNMYDRAVLAGIRLLNNLPEFNVRESHVGPINIRVAADVGPFFWHADPGLRHSPVLNDLEKILAKLPEPGNFFITANMHRTISNKWKQAFLEVTDKQHNDQPLYKYCPPRAQPVDTREHSPSQPAPQSAPTTVTIPTSDIENYKLAVVQTHKVVKFLSQTLRIDTNFYPLRVHALEDAVPSEPELDVLQLLRAPGTIGIRLIGPSGAGKTAAVRRLMWELQKSDEIFFFLSLRDHALHRPRTARPDVLGWIRESLKTKALDKKAIRYLHDKLDAREGVFIFDGFDELRADRTWANAVASSIEASFSGRPRNRVVITARREEDFFGHLAIYPTYLLQALSRDDLETCLVQMGIPAEDRATTLELLRELRTREFQPVMLLIAAAIAKSLRSGARPNSQQGPMRSTFYLLDQAMKTVLSEPERFSQPGPERDSPFTMEELREMRFAILDRAVRGWEFSRTPCLINIGLLKRYLADVLPGRSAGFVRDYFRWVIPTGLCLDRVSETSSTPEFRFLHNMIQDYFYARALIGEILNGQLDLFKREYYSAEILKLIAGAIKRHEIDILLKWLADSSIDPMARKVSAGLLGFVTNLRERRPLIDDLRAIFKSERDPGIAGRIAEALRRLGSPNEIGQFIVNLPNYQYRNRRPDATRDLTFEIFEPLQGFDDKADLLREHLAHTNPRVRKNALILLMRLQRRLLDRKIVVRYCCRDLSELVDAPRTKPPEEGVLELIRSMRYGIEALKRVGCETEEKLVMRIRDVLAGAQLIDTRLESHVDDVIAALRQSPWLPPLIVDPSPGDLDAHVIYLVRHAESTGNDEERLLGRQLGGELTPRGMQQVTLTAEYLRQELAQFEGRIVLISSTSNRAICTAQPIGAALVCSVNPEPDLDELDVGGWSGQVRADIERSAQFRRWLGDKWLYVPPNGESLFEVRTRACQALFRWLFQAQQQRKALVVVTHFFPLTCIYDMIGGTRCASPANASITSYAIRAGTFTPGLVNYTAHLGSTGHTSVSYV